jgi:hypothetical protein
MATILLCVLLDAYSGKASEIPDKRDKSWVSWLQLEWLYQNYFNINHTISFLLFFISAYLFLKRGLSLWTPVFQVVISTFFLPLALSPIFRIIKKDEFGEFHIRQSRVGRFCFAYLAERMVNLDRIREAIRYMKYSLEMLNSQCQEYGFRVKSVRKAIFLLEVLSSREASHPDELRKLASILANSRTIDEYVAHLVPFLKDFKWFEDIEKALSKRYRLPIRKIVTSGAVAAFVSWLIWFIPDEVKSSVLSTLITVLQSHEFLLWVLPGLIISIVFFYLGRLVPKYRVKLSDLEVLAEHFEEK